MLSGGGHSIFSNGSSHFFRLTECRINILPQIFFFPFFSALYDILCGSTCPKKKNNNNPVPTFSVLVSKYFRTPLPAAASPGDVPTTWLSRCPLLCPKEPTSEGPQILSLRLGEHLAGTPLCQALFRCILPQKAWWEGPGTRKHTDEDQHPSCHRCHLGWGLPRVSW